MDFTELRAAGAVRHSKETWEYFQGTADGDHDRDSRAWTTWDLVPRVLTELTAIDTSVSIGGAEFSSPVVLAPSASQGALDAEGEIATRRAGAAQGMLTVYSFHATIKVERFARAADTPWWAQTYALEDRTGSDGYLRRCAAEGASAIVLTVDVPGTLADTPFRRLPLSASVADRGNHERDTEGRAIPVVTESNLGPAEITRTAEVSGLPVWVKGVMTAADANRAIDAGAAGIWASNHGRRQLPSVAPTASVLSEIVTAVAERVPVIVDGGIRSGTDVVRALAMGASAAAIGRPVPWALAVDGQRTLDHVLDVLADEVRSTMAGLGAGSVDDLVPDMLRPAIV